MMQRIVQVWVNNLSLYPGCCGSCVLFQCNRCTFFIHSGAWMLVIKFNTVFCLLFYYFHEEEEECAIVVGTMCTWAPLMCLHQSDIQWELRASEFQGCCGHDHILQGLCLYCCYHLLLLCLHQAHFHSQIRLLHQSDSPLSSVQHCIPKT